MAEIFSRQPGERPAVALDVDGVLIVHDEVRPDGWMPHPNNNPYESYRPEQGIWLRRLNEIADIYYLSAHADGSHEDIGKHLELSEFDWINFWRFKDTPEVWQQTTTQRSMNTLRRASLEAVVPDRPLVWIDDDLTDQDFAWASARRLDNLPTLVVKPDSYEGLTEKHMECIYRWLGTKAISNFFYNM